jgi:hypothetical protein
MAATMGRLAKADPLLAMVVATRESVPIEVQQQLAASGDATILERLAANPQTDGVVLGRIAGTNAATAASVARHPNAPPDALASLAASADPAVRMALLEHPKVPVATLSRLAADMDADVRKALAKTRHLRRLPPDDLARLIADPDVDVRADLPGHDAVLSVEQLTILAHDNSPEVRQAVARALSEQALWQQVPVGAAEPRAPLLATLLKDAVAAVRFAALPGVSAAEQDEFVASLPEAERARVGAELAKSTRSVTLMMRAANNDVADATAVAENPASHPPCSNAC